MFVLCVDWGGGLMAEPNPEELFNLGIKNYDKQDFSKAKEYFEKACDLKDGLGCAFLGGLYYSGEGVEKDLIKATYLYSKACELKEGDGCGVLGVLYVNGQGVEKDLTKVAQYASKACKLGVQEICEALKE
ncbi:hypothetical protein ID0405_03400 [Helicobacter pylori]